MTSADGIAAAKSALRLRMRAENNAIPAAERSRADAAISAMLLALPAIRAATVVAVYASRADEIATGPLIAALQSRGTTVLLPVLQPDDGLIWRALGNPGELVPGRLGLLEPGAAAAHQQLATADVVIVPGVCYDPHGRRLGRGGGSYDRALSDLPAKVGIIGLALDSAVIDVVPVDSHDQRVDVIVTPTRVIPIEGGR